MALPIAEAAQAVQGLVFNAKFAVAIAGAGAAIGIGLIGYAAASAVGRNPGAFGKILTISIIGMALAEAIAFYALFL